MQSTNRLLTVAVVTLICTSIGKATEPAGVVSNVELAKGRTISDSNFRPTTTFRHTPILIPSTAR